MKPKGNRVLALEAKSYLDSPGVRVEDLRARHAVPEGRYKLFTYENYRDIVLRRLRHDLIAAGMANEDTGITLGLVAGNVYQRRSDELRALFDEQGGFFWSPEDAGCGLPPGDQ